MSTGSGPEAAARKRSAESRESAEITKDKKKTMLPETTTDKGKKNLMSAEMTTDKKSTEIATDKRRRMSAEIATDKRRKMSAEIATDERRKMSAEIATDERRKMSAEIATDKRRKMSAEIATDERRRMSAEIATDKRRKMSAEIATDKRRKMSAEIATDKRKNELAENKTADEEKKSSSAEISTDKRKDESAKSKEKKEPGAEGATDKGKNSTTGEEFEFFFGKSSPFSQHHPAEFVIDDVTYNCAEQYMMHQKAVLFKDEAMARSIMASSNPVEQKRFGRKVRNFDKDRWAQRSKQVVREASRAKFWQNPKLLETLLATHPRTLVEAAPRDRLWGIGLGASNPKARNRSQWRGRNLLGEILTEVRAELRLKGRAVMDVPVPVSRN